uniref:Uncharacterized protein n=1 Tax=Varanus komodoensis TaxID=61221 RepID=A0A8D2J968_VARKO
MLLYCSSSILTLTYSCCYTSFGIVIKCFKPVQSSFAEYPANCHLVLFKLEPCHTLYMQLVQYTVARLITGTRLVTGTYFQFHPTCVVCRNASQPICQSFNIF